MADQVIRVLRRDGWYFDRQNGSHATFRHDERPGRNVAVPRHGAAIIKPKTLASIIDQAGFTRDQFRRLL